MWSDRWNGYYSLTRALNEWNEWKSCIWCVCIYIVYIHIFMDEGCQIAFVTQSINTLWALLEIFAEFTNIILNEVNRTKWCCFAFDLTDGACCRTSKPYLKVLIFFIQTYAKECDCDSIYSQCTVSKYEMDVLWHMSIESVSVVCIIDTTRHTCYITTRTFWRQSVHHK